MRDGASALVIGVASAVFGATVVLLVFSDALLEELSKSGVVVTAARLYLATRPTGETG